MAPSITQGVAYVLTNAMGGSAIQISLEDMTTIKGNPFTGLPNQQVRSDYARMHGLPPLPLLIYLHPRHYSGSLCQLAGTSTQSNPCFNPDPAGLSIFLCPSLALCQEGLSKQVRYP